ncbi:hypothetical protein K491DRAFT_697092 [Lophiostoma macrostomum CBS 122681]|uniref:RBR-type E3 ubiquitin transferase n=1 Tax=Lophiostoma macrostomum CBS 122681 TaxID=1314788 RepID=A0A6A6SVL3_9PLEO|nr:hypothetical protein K491DRAFT_697092 [Lophiostoma macrostomum CBS 122681]
MAVTRSNGTRRGDHGRVLRPASLRAALQPGTGQAAAASQPPKPKRRRRRAGADPWTARSKNTSTSITRQRRPLPTHYTCRICAEERTADNFIRWIPFRSRKPYQEIPAPCIDHLARNPGLKNLPVCKSCIGNSMRAKMETVGARNLEDGCLEPGCTSYWNLDLILKYLPKDAVEQFNLGMFSVWKQGAQLFTCTAPVPNGEGGGEGTCGAEGLAELTTPGYPQVSCSACATRMCATCKIPWHTGYTCAEYAARHVNATMTSPEKRTLDFMQTRDAKRCPNCFLVIEKDGGCNSMFCEGCKTFFDWAHAASAVPGSYSATGPHELMGHLVNLPCEEDALQEQPARERRTNRRRTIQFVTASA